MKLKGGGLPSTGDDDEVSLGYDQNGRLTLNTNTRNVITDEDEEKLQKVHLNLDNGTHIRMFVDNIKNEPVVGH